METCNEEGRAFHRVDPMVANDLVWAKWFWFVGQRDHASPNSGEVREMLQNGENE